METSVKNSLLTGHPFPFAIYQPLVCAPVKEGKAARGWALVSVPSVATARLGQLKGVVHHEHHPLEERLEEVPLLGAGEG